MSRKDRFFSHETMSKRRNGFQFWNACEARPPRRSRRQGIDWKARPQRPLPLRLRTQISKSAALPRAGFSERDYYTRW